MKIFLQLCIPFMKRAFFIILSVLIMASCRQEPVTLCVLETTDLHGEVGAPMSKVAEYIRVAYKEYGDNLILLDGGDNFQGSPEVFYSNYVDTLNPHIYRQIFNMLPYSAIAVGNHDFEVGRKVYERVYGKIKVPVLCANIVYTKSKKPCFQPYSIIRKKGYKIAILGLVTPYALNWLPANLRKGMSFVSIDESAEKWVDHIQKRERPDLIIGLFHTGNGKTNIDSASWEAENIPGIDLICCGHIHNANLEQIIDRGGDATKIMNAGSKAEYIAKAIVSITPVDGAAPKIDISTELIKTDTLSRRNREYDEMIIPFMEKAKAYYDVPVCEFDTTIYSKDALKGPCGWTDFLHKSYKKITRTMGYTGSREVGVTIVAPSSEAVLHKGQLTIRDFIMLYPHEDKLSIVEMTGLEIKDYLEYVYSRPTDNPNMPIYEFDSASGVDYSVDTTQSYGNRVTIYSMYSGNKFYPDRRYLVAMNSFRAAGGGGHLGYGLGWNPEKIKARILNESSRSIRAMMMDIYSSEPIDVTPEATWKFEQQPE